MKRLIPLVCVLCLAAVFGAFAADDSAAVIAHLARQLGVKPAEIAPAPIPGLYRVLLGPQVAYVSADGRYFLHGDIIDLKHGDNLTRTERAHARLAYLQQIGESGMIVFAPAHIKRSITVLTDIDCEYCRLLEQDRPALNAMGVEVRYLFYPRDGVGTASWNKAVTVWCAKDRKAAFTAAMHGQPVSGGKCNAAPVNAGYEFGRLLGIDGTPAIITDRGRLIDGYIPLSAMADMLGVDTPHAAASR
ncbi:MAG TPA: DsbC family protein [Gammaproteobacteria bacterium]|nr:DsbC family protein [Gammaproteobacteria bacterium]